MVAVVELGFSPRDLRRFVDVEFRLNRKEPCWVPPLRAERMRYLDPRKNPFFAHAEVAHFVAVRDGRDAGRIAAVRNRRHEEVHGEPVGFFGFLEAGEDGEVVRALLDAAATWLRSRGLTAMRGPASYDSNEVYGALVEGFDHPPFVMMPWNRPSLPGLLEEAGLAKARDLLAWWVTPDGMPERVRRIADRTLARSGFALRALRKDRFDEEVAIVRDLYNRAWERNWGFVPLSDEEIAYKATDLRRIVEPEIVLFVLRDGREVGFLMALPDANQALLTNRSGRLLPFGLLRILWRWRKIDRIRVVTLGLLAEHRHLGLETVLYRTVFDHGIRLGYRLGECSWVLEDNEPMNRGLEAVGGRVAARYRIYERSLAP